MEGVAQALQKSGDAAKLLDEGERTLQDARDAARSGLEQMASDGYRVVVLLDDLERLDRSELLNVLKLVRFVADLPNITVVLSMDDVRARVLIGEGNADPEYGREYIEKYVQAAVRVPHIERRKLAALVYEELAAVSQLYGARIPSSLSITSDALDLYGSSLTLIIQMIRVPRDLARWSNSLTLLLLSDERTDLNVEDAALISAVETFHPVLYERIRRNRELLTGERDLRKHLFENEQARRQRISTELEALTYHPHSDARSIYGEVVAALFGDVQRAHEPVDRVSVDLRPDAERRIRSANHFDQFFGGEIAPGMYSQQGVLALVSELENVAGIGNGYEGVAEVLRSAFGTLDRSAQERLISDLHIHLGSVDRPRLQPIGLGVLHLFPTLEAELCFQLFSAVLLRVCGPSDNVRYGDAESRTVAARLIRAAIQRLPWHERSFLISRDGGFAPCVTDDDWKELAQEWSQLLNQEIEEGLNLYEVYDESTADYIMYSALKTSVELRVDHKFVPGRYLGQRMRDYVASNPERFGWLVEFMLKPVGLKMLDPNREITKGDSGMIAESVMSQIDEILHDPGYSTAELRSNHPKTGSQAPDARMALRDALRRTSGETGT